MEELELVVLVSDGLCKIGPGESECLTVSIVKLDDTFYWIVVVLV
jgi:hypothetical protein